MADGDVKKFKIKQTTDSYDEWNPEFITKKIIKKTVDPISERNPNYTVKKTIIQIGDDYIDSTTELIVKKDIIQTGVSYEEWNPEFTVNKELKRTGCGFPYTFPIIQEYLGCDALDYCFRWNPALAALVNYVNSICISVSGGIGPFNWSVANRDFELDSITTEGRTNVIGINYPAAMNAVGIVIVTDSCGNSVSGIVKGCYAKVPFIYTSRTYSLITDVEQVELTGINLVKGAWIDLIWPSDESELGSITLSAGVFKQTLKTYELTEEAELSSVDLTAGIFKCVIVTYDDGIVEEVELNSIDLSAGEFRVSMVNYENYIREEIELTSISLTEGSHETS